MPLEIQSGINAANSATNATNATNVNVTDDNATNAVMYPVWVTTNTGNLPVKVSSTGMTWNPSTGTFSNTSEAITTAGNNITGPATLNGANKRADFEIPWVNGDITAGGAVSTYSMIVATLPAKTILRNAYIIVTGTAAGTTTCLATLGRTGATYNDYIVSKTLQAAANTIYGAVSGDRGTNATGYDLPSWSATTAVYMQVITTGGNVSAVTGSSGVVVLETSRLL